MEFLLEQATQILERTPATLSSLLRGLAADWTMSNEGPDTFSAFDVLGHLIHGEETDWIPRARIILEHGETKAFEPFDRFAQFENSKGKSIDQLLDQFQALRKHNLETLERMSVTPEKLKLRGTHPELGSVTLSELLATWSLTTSVTSHKRSELCPSSIRKRSARGNSICRYSSQSAPPNETS